MLRIGPHLDAGQVHGDDEVRDAPVLRHVVAGARDEDAELGVIGERRPDLLPVDVVHVAVAFGARAEVGEVGARARLAEQLAPQLLAREHRQEVALLLLVVAERDDDRPAVPDADRVHGFGDAGAAHLTLDDQLQRRIGIEPVRARPVRHDEAGIDQLAGSRGRMLGRTSDEPRCGAGRLRQEGRRPRPQSRIRRACGLLN